MNSRDLIDRALAEDERANAPLSNESSAYKTGYANGQKSFYWAWMYARDLEGYENPQDKLDFYNGYHDSLADKYSLERAAHLTDVKDIPTPLIERGEEKGPSAKKLMDRLNRDLLGRSARLTGALLGENAESEHATLYDRLVSIGDEHGPDSDVYQYVDLIADIYNGGIQQCIEHGRGFGEFRNAASFLRAMGGPQARKLADAFLSLKEPYTLAKEEYERSTGDDDPLDEFLDAFDPVEDLLYDKEATNEVHRELLSNPDLAA